MSTIAVTGASGQLGRLIVTELLDRRIPAADIVAVVRTPAKVADLAERGIQVRVGDYARPETLLAALAGVDSVVLVSSNEVGQRLPQHQAVIDAAVAAGVSRIVYTSLLRADSSPSVLAPEHKATEEAIKASGITATILRNGWYIENYTDHLADYLRDGAIVNAAGDGKVSGAARIDYAAAAAAVLTNPGHEDATYELGGTVFTMTDLAAAISETAGTAVSYQQVSPAAVAAHLETVGLDATTAQFVAALDEGAARGDLVTDSIDLTNLIGRESTPLASVVKTAIAL